MYRIKETSAFIISDGLPQADVVPIQMQQIFQNLISNALKFSKKDEPPQVTVTYQFLQPSKLDDKRLQTAPQFLQISSKDNSNGFIKGSAEKIFGLLQRLHGK